MGLLDLAAKALMADAPLAFAALALGGASGIRSAAAEETEVQALARRVDKLLRVELAGQREPLFFQLEVFASWTSSAPRRVFEYWALLRRPRRQVSSLALCLKPGSRQGPAVGRYRVRERGTELTFEFPVIRLWEWTIAQLAARDPALLPFAPYARDANEQSVDDVMRRLARVRPVARRADYQAALAVFAGNVFPTVDWKALIPKEVFVRNTFIDAVKLEANQELLATLLVARLGRKATRYVRRLPRCSQETANAVAVAIAKKTDPELLERLDELLPPLSRSRARARR